MAYFDYFANGQGTILGNYLEKKTKYKEFQYISKYINYNKNAEILEIGPGQGILADFFIKNGYRNYDVVEPNDKLRQIMIGIGARNTKKYLIPELQEKDSSYDLIIICDVFEHLNDYKEGSLFIRETTRVLNKGGILCLISPDFMSWGKDFYCDASHNFVTTVRRLIIMHTEAGLKTIHFKYNYACFSGLLGFLIGTMIKILTFWSKGNGVDSKPYKLRLTFLRRFAIVGKK